MAKEFNNKTVVVTGAGAGIGKGICQQLYQEGAQIIAVSLVQSELDELKKQFPGIRTIQVDLSNWSATVSALSNLGPVHGLVNNAGCAKGAPLLEVTEEAFDKQYSVNVKALVNVSQIIVKTMIANNIKGSVVNIASVTAKKAFVNLIAYCGTKGAVVSTTKAMAVELGKYGIRANSISPTLVQTELAKSLWKDKVALERFIQNTPLRRTATVEDIANAAVFLLSDRSSMMTGTDITVDGGFTA